jgi:hydrogenase nickel incorporation protein HypA/HybF
MHELAISETIIKIIGEEARKRGMKDVSRARLRIGLLNAFDKENLGLCLKSMREKTGLSDIKFDIEDVPVGLTCAGCGAQFDDARFEDREYAHRISHAPISYEPLPCPSCGSRSVSISSGDVMQLIEIS